MIRNPEQTIRPSSTSKAWQRATSRKGLFEPQKVASVLMDSSNAVRTLARVRMFLQHFCKTPVKPMFIGIQ
jgi:hypothetical protein